MHQLIFMFNLSSNTVIRCHKLVFVSIFFSFFLLLPEQFLKILNKNFVRIMHGVKNCIRWILAGWLAGWMLWMYSNWDKRIVAKPDKDKKTKKQMNGTKRKGKQNRTKFTTLLWPIWKWCRFFLFKGILRFLRVRVRCMTAIWSNVSSVHGDGNILLCSNENKYFGNKGIERLWLNWQRETSKMDC